MTTLILLIVAVGFLFGTLALLVFAFTYHSLTRAALARTQDCAEPPPLIQILPPPHRATTDKGKKEKGESRGRKKALKPRGDEGDSR